MAANHDAGFYCDFCNFFCGSTQSLRFFKHLVNTHSNDPNFKVYCGYCPRSFTKVNSLQKHYYRDHKNVIQNNDENPNLEIQGTLNYNDSGNYSPDSDQQNIDSETTYKNLKHHAAKFLLCAKERGKITQTALNMVKDSTKTLLSEYFEVVKNVLVEKIRDEVGAQFQFSRDMDELFEVDKVFEGLDTEYQQNSYYEEQFGLVVRYVIYPINNPACSNCFY